MGQRESSLIRKLTLSVVILASVIFIPLLYDVGQPVTRFAVIGDYGTNNAAERSVAALVASWQPDFVVTTGDNNYPAGSGATIDENIGDHYGAYLDGRFWPTLGNHDWQSISCSGETCTGPHLTYFALPGNERYYAVLRGPVHLFVLDSDSREPSGITDDSNQSIWLQNALAASVTPWQIVVTHHPPYSSARHGSTKALQWPYAAWGADAVLSGHDHVYERLQVDGLTYIVNGAGGASLYEFRTPVPGSQTRYNGLHGAMLVIVTVDDLTLQFWSVQGVLIDEVSIDRR